MADNSGCANKANMVLLWSSIAAFGLYGLLAVSRLQRKREKKLLSGISDLTKVPLKSYVEAEKKNIQGSRNELLEQKDVMELFRQRVSSRGVVCVVLAAGEGSRFRASIPKVIYPFNGKPMALYAVDAAEKVNGGPIPVVFIVGHEKELVLRTLGGNRPFVTQYMRMGTGHAVYLSKDTLPDRYEGDIIVTYADNPGIDSHLLNRFIECHRQYKQQFGAKYVALILTGKLPANEADSSNYGRIIRDEDGNVLDIIERKQIDRMKAGTSRRFGANKILSKEQLYEVDEFNSGIVIARAKQYFEALGRVRASQIQHDQFPKYEYYVTDFVARLRDSGFVVKSFQVSEQENWKLEGANTVEELDKLGTKFWALGTR
eukprot:jgi/Galph1/3368/GphlegSOOS_G2029.1